MSDRGRDISTKIQGGIKIEMDREIEIDRERTEGEKNERGGHK